MLKVEQLPMDANQTATVIPGNGFEDDAKTPLPCDGTPATCGFLPTLDDAPGTNYQWRDEQMLYRKLECGLPGKFRVWVAFECFFSQFRVTKTLNFCVHRA